MSNDNTVKSALCKENARILCGTVSCLAAVSLEFRAALKFFFHGGYFHVDFPEDVRYGACVRVIERVDVIIDQAVDCLAQKGDMVRAFLPEEAQFEFDIGEAHFTEHITADFCYNAIHCV